MASWDFSFYLLCPPSLCSFHDIMLSACVGMVLFPGDIWILSHLGWDLQEKKKSWPVVLRVSGKRATDAYKIVCPCRHMKCISEVSKATVRQSSQHKTRCVDADFFFLKMEVVFFFSDFQAVQFSDFHTLEATPLESPWKRWTHTHTYTK